MALTFDTLKLAQKLESSGFSAEQATGAAEALSENLSINKDDLVTKEQFSTLRADFQTDLQKELKPLKSDIISLKTDIAIIKAELGMIKWMMGGAIFSILFLLLIKTFLV